MGELVPAQNRSIRTGRGRARPRAATWAPRSRDLGKDGSASPIEPCGAIGRRRSAQGGQRPQASSHLSRLLDTRAVDGAVIDASRRSGRRLGNAVRWNVRLCPPRTRSE